MATKTERELQNSLATYCTALRASAVKHAGRNWQRYAAVTGSAMAMATGASASIIYAAGPVSTNTLPNVAVTNQSGSGHEMTVKNVPLKTVSGGNLGTGFSFGAAQNIVDGGNLRGSAFLENNGAMGFLFTFTHDKVVKLASGVQISANSPVSPVWEGGKNQLASTSVNSVSHNNGGWAPGQTGFAAFEVLTAGQQTDYGWIRLEYFEGSNGLANGVEAIDWAYATNGAPITTGEGAAPEPGTMGTGLLAAGAAGVAALRRRRKGAAK